jgi:putative FmdB family regulatory protein
LPLYEYQCAKDGTFERMQKFSDPPLAACPTCGGPIEKLLSAPAIQFKGTGWYVTDYAKKSGGGDPGGKDKDSSKEAAAGKDSSSSGKDSSSKDSSSSATPSTSSSTSTDKK